MGIFYLMNKKYFCYLLTFIIFLDVKSSAREIFCINFACKVKLSISKVVCKQCLHYTSVYL